MNIKLLNNDKGITNTKITIIIGVIVIIILGIFLFFKFTKNPTSINEKKYITITLKDYNYYPNTIKLKKGVPVELTLDNSIQGCLRTFTIKDLGVYKSSNSPDDKIEFTPNKTGKFEFACSMHMGYGTIIVEE